MVYEYIIHPRTNEKIKIKSEKAVKIITTYIKQLNAYKNKFK